VSYYVIWVLEVLSWWPLWRDCVESSKDVFRQFLQKKCDWLYDGHLPSCSSAQGTRHG